jgi:hypothetical protein
MHVLRTCCCTYCARAAARSTNCVCATEAYCARAAAHRAGVCRQHSPPAPQGLEANCSIHPHAVAESLTGKQHVLLRIAPGLAGSIGWRQHTPVATALISTGAYSTYSTRCQERVLVLVRGAKSVYSVSRACTERVRCASITVPVRGAKSPEDAGVDDAGPESRHGSPSQYLSCVRVGHRDPQSESMRAAARARAGH